MFITEPYPVLIFAGAWVVAAGYVLGLLSRRRRSGRGTTARGACVPSDTDDVTDEIVTVKRALENLWDHVALSASPLAQVRDPWRRNLSGTELQAMLIELTGELAESSRQQDWQAGRILVDYYVKRVGSHEVVMQRLYLSRPTFYRRLRHGLALVAQRLERRRSGKASQVRTWPRPWFPVRADDAA